VLLAIGTVFFPQGIITPELLRRPGRSVIAQVDVASASETIPQKEVK
jgi:hypothetical protein